MPRRSRYPGGKNAPQGRGRRPGSKVKSPEDRSSVPVVSEHEDIQSVTPAPVSFAKVQNDAPPPPYILRELKRTALISGSLLILLVVLSLVL